MEPQADSGQAYFDAVIRSDVPEIERLIAKHGSPPDRSAAANAFVRASQEGRLEVVEAFLRAGANPNVQSVAGATPLIAAAESGHLAIVHTLLRHGASPHQADSHHWTPLFYAARAQHLEVVRALVAAGADIAHRDVEGHSALDVSQWRPIKGPFSGSGVVNRSLHDSDVTRLLRSLLDSSGSPGVDYDNS